ncbi:MAG: DUF1840 domain-containing protein [Gammaproteobacteria bacterium]|nr:DUF1840 domain-containing protein [Gammaproteobacteria bacterium]MCP5458282.1 DUF1840 domain-containing protein [Gammaproteobacteria bacterium]
MLVTFSCSAYADITLFGDVATHFLHLMGHSGAVPGALLAEDVPEALKRLETALKTDAASDSEPPPNDKDEESPVGLANRAWPLLELLKAAVKADSDVMWDKNR